MTWYEMSQPDPNNHLTCHGLRSSVLSLLGIKKKAFKSSYARLAHTIIHRRICETLWYLGDGAMGE